MPLDAAGKYRMNPNFVRAKYKDGESSKAKELEKFIASTGKLWTGTKLSGYGDQGPYHCGECKYLAGELCKHEIVKADPQVKKNAEGMPIVNAAHGCCEFVDPR